MKLFLLLLVCIAASAQTTIQHGVGPPDTANCGAARQIGRVYMDSSVNPPNEYGCGSTGWSILGSTSNSGGNAQYPANQPLTGLGVHYVSGLTYQIGAGTYTIGGVLYSVSTITSVTLAAADVTNPRIDVIYAKNDGTINVLTGTPAATPAQPTVDYSTQLPLNIATVAANATTPSGVSTTTIYDENTEWTCTSTAHIDCTSTSGPYHGTVNILATAAVLGNSFTLVKPASGTTDLSTLNSLVCYINPIAQWPTGNGAGSNGLRTLSLFWLSGSTQVGNQVVIKDGSFGFLSSRLSYQQISIPLGATGPFGTGTNTVTSLKGQITGNGGTSPISFHLDWCTLQAGTGTVNLPTGTLIFKGPWSSATNYNVNDMVISGGLYYIASVANLNVAVSTASTWTQPSSSGAPSGAAGGSLGGTYPNPSIATSVALPGSPTTTTQSQNDGSTKIGTTAYTDLAVANGIAGVNPAVAVLAASTANVTGTYANGAAGIGATFTVTATGAFTLDGIAINTIGQRVLFKDQTSGFQNGMYTATVIGATAISPVFTRALDYDMPSDINNTGAIPVQSGTANIKTSWLLTSNVTTIGTDVLTFVQFSYNPASSTTCTAPQFLSAMALTGVGTCLTPVLTRNSVSTAYTTVLGDAGKMLAHLAADNNARTITIDSNANVAYPIGTCLNFINMINTITIAITSDTMTLMGSNTTGSRTLAVGNWATACKVDTTVWVIGGSSGLT